MTLFAGSFVKSDLLSFAGMNIVFRIGSKAGFCQFVPPEMPGFISRSSVDASTASDRIGRPVDVSPFAQLSSTNGAPGDPQGQESGRRPGLAHHEG